MRNRFFILGCAVCLLLAGGCQAPKAASEKIADAAEQAGVLNQAVQNQVRVVEEQRPVAEQAPGRLEKLDAGLAQLTAQVAAGSPQLAEHVKQVNQDWAYVRDTYRQWLDWYARVAAESSKLSEQAARFNKQLQPLVQEVKQVEADRDANQQKYLKEKNSLFGGVLGNILFWALIAGAAWTVLTAVSGLLLKSVPVLFAASYGGPGVIGGASWLRLALGYVQPVYNVLVWPYRFVWKLLVQLAGTVKGWFVKPDPVLDTPRPAKAADGAPAAFEYARMDPAVRSAVLAVLKSQDPALYEKIVRELSQSGA